METIMSEKRENMMLSDTPSVEEEKPKGKEKPVYDCEKDADFRWMQEVTADSFLNIGVWECF
jgi:hypothetical protein